MQALPTPLDLRDGCEAAVLMEAFDQLPQAVSVLDRSGYIIATNDRWTAERRNAANTLVSTGVGDNFMEDLERMPEAQIAVGEHIGHGLSRVLEQRAERFELQYSVDAGDDTSWFLFTASRLDGVGAVVTQQETTVHHSMHEVLADLAFHDSLTGLPNRALVLDRLRMALIRAQRNQLMPAVVFIDLDGFKVINDRYGHEAGDVVLQEIARRLSHTVREHDTCGRWGGDEFVLVIELAHADGIAGIVERTLASATEPVALRDGAVAVGMSIGVAVGHGAERADELLRIADKAMYEAKRSNQQVRIALNTA
jgi:diguanylate cyclase (GGDEF)-like protein